MRLGPAAARHPVLGLRGASFGLWWTDIAITLARRMAIGAIGVKLAGGFHEIAGEADVAITRLVIGEVGP